MADQTPAKRDIEGATKGQAILQRMASQPGTTKGRIISSMAPGSRMSSQKPKVDICFVFDTTGSMSNKIHGLIECMKSFVDELGKMDLDWRTTVLPFGDLTVGDRVDAQLPFVSDIDGAKSQLQNMPRFWGGSNEGESSVEAMSAGLGKPWREKTVRVIVLLTDEPALGSHQDTQSIDLGLTQHDVICFVASVPTNYYRSWATSHGGEWLEIGQTMKTTGIVSLLQSLLPRVAKVAHDVHALAGGSVKQYLSLPAAARGASTLPPQ